ncbi:MAG TPA: hypothetical protein VJB68_05245 [Methylophilaceae bacterium]|nr:hypothetical protein [Methylophilaceae bacterium]
MSALWLVAVAVYLVVGGIHQALIKSLTDSLPRATSMAWQFGLAALMVFVFGVASGDLVIAPIGIAIAATGAINFFGAYCQWRAYSFSLSRTSMLLPLVPLWAALLASALLSEAALYQETYLAVGIVLLHGAAFLLAWQRSPEASTSLDKSWLMFTLGMLAIQGSATLLVKVFADRVQHGLFLPYWYLGAFLGSMILLLFQGDWIKLPPWGLRRIALSSATMAGSMAAAFWAFQLAPAGLVLPLQSFGSALLPMALGWLVFREAQRLNRYQWTGFAVGAAGFIAVLAATL